MSTESMRVRRRTAATRLALALVVLSLTAVTARAGRCPVDQQFRRGDVNSDGGVDLADAAFLIAFLESGSPVPRCLDAADADDDGAVDEADAFALIEWALGARRDLPEPFPGAGCDPTEDRVSCLDARVVPPPPPDGLLTPNCDGPANLEAGASGVEQFLRLSSPGAIEGFALHYLVDTDVVTLRELDFEKTVVAGVPELSGLSSSSFFSYSLAPDPGDPDSPVRLLEVEALFATKLDGIHLVSVPASGGLDDARLVRMVFDVSDDVAPGEYTPFRPLAAPVVVSGGVSRETDDDCAWGYIVPEPEIFFLRADSNSDLTVDISDGQATLCWLFLGCPPPQCLDAADANDDAVVDVSDPMYTLGYLFLGGPAPPSPFSASPFAAGCGPDRTAPSLGCLASACRAP